MPNICSTADAERLPFESVVLRRSVTLSGMLVRAIALRRARIDFVACKKMSPK